MGLFEEFNKSGNRLFKNRSFIPVILYPLATLIILTEKAQTLYHPDLVWSAACLFVSLVGLFVRILVIGYVPKGTSGRNRKQQAASILNTKGIYSVVRHPLYLGNFLMWFGLILYSGNIWFAITAILLFWIYYERIMFAEEEYLRQKFSDDFDHWAEKTPAFIPVLKKWEKPDLTFSIKKVIRREYRGLFAVIFSFAYLNMLKNISVNQHFTLSHHWVIILVIGMVFFIIVHLLNKKSNLLKPQSDVSRSKVK